MEGGRGGWFGWRGEGRGKGGGAERRASVSRLPNLTSPLSAGY